MASPTPSRIRTRLFLTCWIVFTVHFATNTVREHYPAFSLIEDRTLKVDRYLDFHPDIFAHTDGHAYVGNNVAGSYVAVLPLLLFDPALDALERWEKAQLEVSGVGSTEYRVEDHPNSQVFYRMAKEAGLTLRFGGSAAVTSAFLMAPLMAGMVVLIFSILVDRAVGWRRALWISLLFAFGTPIFFRAGVLNHNVMLMATTFLAFVILWRRGEDAQPGPRSTASLAGAGALAGFGLALDYAGVIPLLCLYGYVLATRLRARGWWGTIRESMPFVLGSVPPVLFLLYTQWAMFGNPFLPGQYWMPDASTTAFGTFENPYSTDGFRGFTLPAPDLYLLNLFDPSYGLFTYGPLLVVGLIPAWRYPRRRLVLPRSERWFNLVFFLAFLTFCSANQYSRIQFNSGFRYMIPVVPFLFLAASDHLARMPRRWLAALSVPVIAHSWVIAMVREPVPESWRRVLTEGIQLPWLTTLKATRPVDDPIFSNALLPLAVLALTGALVWIIWRWRWSAPTSGQGVAA